MLSNPWPILLTVRMPEQGGCERDMARIAQNIDRSKFAPHVGCFYKEGIRVPDLLSAGVPVVEFPFRGWQSPSSLFKVVAGFQSYVRKHQIQLIHTYDVPTTMFLIPLARLSGIPVRVSSQLSLRELNTAGQKMFLRSSDRLAQRVVVNSKAVLEDMVARYGVERDKLSLIYNGVDTQDFHTAGRRRMAEVADASIVIGSVAALRPEKQFQLLIEAFAKARHIRPGAKLLMVGGGDQKPILQQRAAELQVEDDIVWVGPQTNVSPWMRSIDIFVLPSRSESFPNGLLEAMACGCCPVGSAVGGIPELIEHERSGLLFPSGDSQALSDQLARLLQDDALRNTCARNAAARAADGFTLNRFVQSTADLYDDLLCRHFNVDRSPVVVHS